MTSGLARRLPHLVDIAIIVTAAAGIGLFWSEYSYFSTWSRSYGYTEGLRAGTIQAKADYELTTLPWRTGASQVLDFGAGAAGGAGGARGAGGTEGMTVVTGAEPFAYQVYATVSTGGAVSAHLQFDTDIQSGGATIGLLKAGKWTAQSSSERVGEFSDVQTALVGDRRSVTVVIANHNTAGESRLTVKSLRLFFRK